MDARFSRRAVVRAGLALGGALGTALGGGLVIPGAPSAPGAGAGDSTGPIARVDLAWATKRLHDLNLAHAAGVEVHDLLSDLGFTLHQSAVHGDWTTTDRTRVRILCAQVCERAAMTAWGRAQEDKARTWASRGMLHAEAAGDADTYAHLASAKALAWTFTPGPSPRTALLELGNARHPRFTVTIPVSMTARTHLEVQTAYANARLARKGVTSAAYEAVSAVHLADVYADTAQAETGDTGLAAWVHHGVWATVVQASGGKVGGGAGNSLLPVLAKGLERAETPRARASTLVAMARQALTDGDVGEAGRLAGLALDVEGADGVPLDARGLRRTNEVARELADRGVEAGVVLRRRLTGTAS